MSGSKNGFSRLDYVYRSLLLTKFFTKGWGKPEHLKRIFSLRRQLASRKTCGPLVHVSTPIELTKEEVKSDHRILEGHFTSPVVNYLPGLLPKETEKAHFQVVLPKKWPDSRWKPMVIQYAGTGDHYFWRRRHLMALPMIREQGVGSVILECPFYGLRKPKEQFRSSLQNVSDLFIMGACLICESAVLYDWCEKEGFGPLVSHGISMGGHMASLGATVWPKPIALVPCLSWTSASLTFTKGCMTGAINWDLLNKQYASSHAFKDDVASLVRCEENAFQAGREFAKSMDHCASAPGQRLSYKDIGFFLKFMYFFAVRDGEASLKNDDQDAQAMEKFRLPFLSSLSTTLSLTSKKGRKDGGVDAAWTYMLPKIIRNDLGEDEVAKRAVNHDVLHREAIQFMRGIMDECTHLKNFDVPVDPELIIIVAAELDAYIPRDGITALPDIWPGATIRYIPGNGHISSYLFKQDVFRKAIYDAIDMYTRKYPLA